MTDIGIRPVLNVGVELVVVDPDACRVADGDAVVAGDEADEQVLDDHVGGVDDVEAGAGDVRRGADADERLVGADFEAGRELDLAGEVDDCRGVAGDGGLEGGGTADSHGGAALAAGGQADGVLSRKTFNVP